MKKAEVLARLGKEAVLHRKYWRPQRVTIIDYGYVGGHYEAFKSPTGHGVLVEYQTSTGEAERTVVRGQDLINRSFDEYWAEIEEAKRQQSEDRSRRDAEWKAAVQRANRLVEIWGYGSVRTYGSSGAITISPEEVSRILEEHDAPSRVDASESAT